MPIPSQKDIEIKLLHLIYYMGGQVRPRDTYDRLADYFRLTEKDRQEVLPSGPKKFENSVQWARNSLCCQGLLNRSIHGIWKITEKGRNKLLQLGLIDKPFPGTESLENYRSVSTSIKSAKPESNDKEIIELIIQEIIPEDPKKFPDDFLDDSCTDFYEVDLPGTQLHFAPLSQTIITSPKGYFRYPAKNPSEAKYILYAHSVGSKKIKIPKNNLTLFKAVKAYEKYCDEMTRMAFELFLDFTNDEHKAEFLTKEVEKLLDLRAKKNQL